MRTPAIPKSSSLRFLSLGALSFALSFAGAACSSSGSSSSPTSSTSAADAGGTTVCNKGVTGKTDCTANTGQCNPGTYCDSANLACAAGCTSNANCVEGERCWIGPNETVGRCETCPAASTRTGRGGGGSPVEPPNGGNDKKCSDDSACNTEQGLDHEICSGGSCQPGCRKNADCGNDYGCDTSIPGGQCVPAGGG